MKKIKKITILLSLLLISTANPVNAASVYFNSKGSDIQPGKFFELEVLIDSQKEDINAISGKLYFPVELLSFIDIKETDSVISFWIDKPQLTNNYVKFAGIIPGGYTNQGNLFKIIFKTRKPGQGDFSIEDIKILLNDGKGTETKAEQQAFSIRISDEAGDHGESVVIIDISDQEPPEAFTPIITKIEDIFGDNYLLIFATQDKKSGIDYYQVKEGRSSFVKAESPYLLKNQKLDEKIIIEAVDKSGNIKQVVIAPINQVSPYRASTIVIVLTAILFLVLGFRTILKKKK